MNMAFGYYLNIFDLYGKRDVFIIFNEANSKPTENELDVLGKLVEAELEKEPSGITLQNAIENSGLECVGFGVQVKAFGLKTRSLEDKNHTVSNHLAESHLDKQPPVIASLLER